MIERIHHLQSLRIFPSQNRGSGIDPEDHRLRIGTIGNALADLKVNLQLLSDLLKIDQPSLCLTLAEGIFLREAAILERLFLLLLAHQPLTGNTGSHYLAERVGKRLRRDLPRSGSLCRKIGM